MFSELVDSVVSKSGRPDQQANIADYVNATVRECQTLARFFKDLKEGYIPVSGSPVIWTYPRDMWKMRAIKYPDGTYPPLIQPGRNQIDKDQYYYAASDYYVFVGINSQDVDLFGNNIAYAYYAYLPRLVYYPAAIRPAAWNEAEGKWVYKDTSIVDDNSAEAISARAKVANWLLDQYREAITEGALAKVFKATGSQDRAVTSYSLYKQLQIAIVNSEAFEALENGGA